MVRTSNGRDSELAAALSSMGEPVEPCRRAKGPGMRREGRDDIGVRIDRLNELRGEGPELVEGSEGFWPAERGTSAGENSRVILYILSSRSLNRSDHGVSDATPFRRLADLSLG